MLVKFEYFETETRLNLDWLMKRNSCKSIKHEPANHSANIETQKRQTRQKDGGSQAKLCSKLPSKFLIGLFPIQTFIKAKSFHAISGQAMPKPMRTDKN